MAGPRCCGDASSIVLSDGSGSGSSSWSSIVFLDDKPFDIRPSLIDRGCFLFGFNGISGIKFVNGMTISDVTPLFIVLRRFLGSPSNENDSELDLLCDFCFRFSFLDGTLWTFCGFGGGKASSGLIRPLLVDRTSD